MAKAEGENNRSISCSSGLAVVEIRGIGIKRERERRFGPGIEIIFKVFVNVLKTNEN